MVIRSYTANKNPGYFLIYYQEQTKKDELKTPPYL